MRMWAWPGGLREKSACFCSWQPHPIPRLDRTSLTFEPALYPGPLQRSLGVYLIPAVFPPQAGSVESLCFTPTGSVLAPTTGLQFLRAGPGTATGSRPPGHNVLMAHSWLPGRSDLRSLAHTEPPASLPYSLQPGAPAWPPSGLCSPTSHQLQSGPCPILAQGLGHPKA